MVINVFFISRVFSNIFVYSQQTKQMTINSKQSRYHTPEAELALYTHYRSATRECTRKYRIDNAKNNSNYHQKSIFYARVTYLSRRCFRERVHHKALGNNPFF